MIDNSMDRISSQRRSAVMSAVKGKGTRLEQEFCRALLEEGLQTFVQNDKELPGCPDVVFPDERVAVFVDSCFWHGCEDHLRMPATNVAYWTKKIDRNRKRDGIVNGLLRARGWKVVRIWEHQVRRPSSSKSVVRSLRAVLEARKMTGTDQESAP